MTVEIDRPLGSCHPRHADLVYEVNYGYLPGTLSGDGKEIDAYVLVPTAPVQKATGRVVALIERTDDDEDKLIVITDDIARSGDELSTAVWFQERYFDSLIKR